VDLSATPLSFLKSNFLEHSESENHMSVAEQVFYASGVPIAVSNGKFDWDYVFAEDVYNAIDIYADNQTMLFNICKTNTDVSVVQHARAIYVLKYGATEFPAPNGPYMAPDYFPESAFTVAGFGRYFASVMRMLFATDKYIKLREPIGLLNLFNRGYISFERITEKAITNTYGMHGISAFKTVAKSIAAAMNPTTNAITSAMASGIKALKEIANIDEPKIIYRTINRLILVHVLANIASNDEPYTNYKYILQTIEETQTLAENKVTPDKILRTFSNSLKTDPYHQARVDAFLKDSEQFMNELSDEKIYKSIMTGLYIHTSFASGNEYHDGDWGKYTFLKKNLDMGIKSVNSMHVDALFMDRDSLKLPQDKMFGVMLDIYRGIVISGSPTFDELLIVYTIAEKINRSIGQFFKDEIKSVIDSFYEVDKARSIKEILDKEITEEYTLMRRMIEVSDMNRDTTLGRVMVKS